MQKKILIVEDDHPIALGLKINLESEGFSTAIIHDGNKAMESFELENPDLILLDVMLPGKSGFEICESIRSSGSTVPILFLTARTLTDDRIRGLELGGDDYISKPFDLRELLLRIKAILRRQEWYKKQSENENSIIFGDNEIFFDSFKAKTAKGEITLTQKEAMLFKLLVEHSGKVVNRNMILDQIWGEGQFPSNRTIDNLILNLRRYFEKDPKNPEFILTQYGVGYIFKS